MEIIQLNSIITRAKVLLDGLNSREMTEDGTSGREDKRTEFTQSEQQAENQVSQSPVGQQKSHVCIPGVPGGGGSGTKTTPEETTAESPELGIDKRHRATASRR